MIPKSVMDRLLKEGRIVSQRNISTNTLMKAPSVEKMPVFPTGKAPFIMRERDGDREIVWLCNLKPQPKGRPRLCLDWDMVQTAIQTRNATLIKQAISITTPEKTRAYEKEVKRQARTVFGAMPLLSGDFEVRVWFFVSSLYRSDVDNYLKAVLDGMNEVAYEDDRRITMSQGFKIKCQKGKECSLIMVRHRPESAPLDQEVVQLLCELQGV